MYEKQGEHRRAARLARSPLCEMYIFRYSKITSCGFIG